MVQLFNVAPTVMDLIKNNDLLWKFTSVFDGVLKMSLNQRGTVSVEHETIRHKVYLRPQRDLCSIVSHSPVAVYILNERLDVFEEILKVVTYLQWMNPYTWNGPVDFENDNAWTLAIQLQINTMAIVFQLIARCYSSAECRETVKQALVEAGNPQALAEIVYICDNCSFVLFSLGYDWQNVGEWWITMSREYLALASFSAVSHIVMYDLITGQVLSLLELPLRIAA
ncbi:unnamed protein product [Sphagnum jensenii]|uniref:E3 ubiquitin-protein ligase n=1 Tax=Sphagnum jensenii TaxID=128206 RepID=A0ABP1ALL0_9BRYO